MFYIVKTTWVGPADNHFDADTIEIRTEPARTNQSNEIKLHGWCGTTNDWSVYALGEYETIEAARAAITAEFGEVRKGDDGESFGSAVETYKEGKYKPLSESDTSEWLHAAIKEDVTADMNDAAITTLAERYETDANNEGFTLYGAEDLILGRRDEMREREAADTDAE